MEPLSGRHCNCNFHTLDKPHLPTTFAFRNRQGICEGDSSDVGPNFKQEAYFHWTFGVLEPDYYGAVDVATGRSILFMPRLPTEYIVFMGHIETLDDAKER